jgi:hypothetical protein
MVTFRKPSRSKSRPSKKTTKSTQAKKVLTYEETLSPLTRHENWSAGLERWR